MKKKIILLIISIGFLIFLFIFYSKYKKATEYKKSITNFPKIELLGYAINKNDFYNKGDVNCYLIFNSECGFCLDEVEDIVDNIEDFKNVNFYLISSETKTTLMEYSEDSEFLGLPNFTILKDKDDFFYDFFKIKTTPSTYLYTKDGLLIDFKQGFIPIYTLKSMISED